MKFWVPRKFVRLVLSVGLLASCDRSNSESASEIQPEMESFLSYGIHNTPYAALVRNVGAKVESLPDTDKADDYSLERWTFTAQVLETYRGAGAETIQYTADVEKGDAPNFGESPFIILLCQSASSLYWPGVGFNFPAGKREKQIAQSAGRSAEKAQTSFEECVP